MASGDGNFGTEAGQTNTEAHLLLNSFWQRMINEIRALNQDDFKAQELPLARIKKIMKLDEDVKMISAEAPVLFSKAAELFISELSLRSWLHTEDNKRRTLQKNDIAMAVTKYDQFDFLIDIVPRDELKPANTKNENAPRAAMMPDQVQYYFQLAQQHQAALQQQQAGSTATTAAQSIQLQAGQVVQQPLQIQMPDGTSASTAITVAPQTGGDGSTAQPQIIQVQQAPVQQQVTQQQTAQQSTQVFQQVITPTGEMQNIPIQLTQQQIQALALQMQGKQPGQPIVIQTSNLGSQQEGQAVQVTEQQSTQQMTQPLFQVPINMGGQQVFVQQSLPSEDQQVDLSDGQ